LVRELFIDNKNDDVECSDLFSWSEIHPLDNLMMPSI